MSSMPPEQARPGGQGAGSGPRRVLLTAAAVLLAFGMGWFGRELANEIDLWWAYWTTDMSSHASRELPSALKVSGAGTRAVNGTYYLYHPSPDIFLYTADGEAPADEKAIWFEAIEGVGWDLWEGALFVYYQARGETAWWSPTDPYMPDKPRSPADLEWAVTGEGKAPVPTIKAISRERAQENLKPNAQNAPRPPDEANVSRMNE